jgi:hypothetical protein
MVEQPDDELVKEVFAHYGLAAYLAHVLERSLVNALSTVYGPGPTRLTPTELERRFEDLSKKGLGALGGVLSEAGLSGPVVARVQAALQDRNRLAHQFFWDHAADFISVEGCERMLADLEEMQHRLADCAASVVAEVHQWAAAHGITTSDFDAVQQTMLDRGRVLTEDEVGEVLASGPRREQA